MPNDDVQIADPLEPPSVNSGKVPVREGDILVGKYRVERVLGLGGMGVVVAATHLQLQQRVAIKFMLPEALKDSSLAERFLHEARAAVRLKSDHIARVLDVGTLDNTAPYMVMEYLEGNDFRAILKSGIPLSVRDVTRYMMQACEAVGEAHELGIVHRDIKPHNLFLTHKANGRPCVKVLDFGISKSIDPSSGTDESALTRTSAVLGSPHYMSPEQMRASRTVDSRTDVWSLGVCLYQLLTSRVPFEAATLLELGGKVLHEPPVPPTTHRPDLPAELVEIVMRCLQKDPARRFARAGELGAALDDFLRGLGESGEWMGPHPAMSAELYAAAKTRGLLQGQTLSSLSGKTGVAWGQTAGTAPKRPVMLVAVSTFCTVLLVMGGILYSVASPPKSEQGAMMPPPQSVELPEAVPAPPNRPSMAKDVTNAPAPPATGVPEAAPVMPTAPARVLAPRPESPPPPVRRRERPSSGSDAFDHP